MNERSIAVLIACHNRKELTVQCVQSLLTAKPHSWSLHFFIADDGSTDGTVAALKSFPANMTYIQGDGSWFWARAMHEAEKLVGLNHDGILWINDDITVYADALRYVDKAIDQHTNAILVGQLEDPHTQKPTYGGFVKISSHPMRYDKVFATDAPLPIDTFNGNFVFVPNQARNLIGSIDGHFQHSYADCDYGLRAQRHHVPVLLLPTFVGTCPLNPPKQFNNRLAHIKFLWSPKGNPLRSQIRFFRRHSPWRWPIYVFGPYIKVILGLQKRQYSNVDNSGIRL